ERAARLRALRAPAGSEGDRAPRRGSTKIMELHSMGLFEIALVAVAAFLAGALNSVAGGGTFFSFPALLAVGVPPVVANASNSVALWPASLSGAWAYRHELARYKRYL